LCDPTYLERCVEVLDGEPDVVLVYPRTRMIGEAGQLLWEHWYNLDMHHRLPHERLKHLIRNLGGLLAPLYGLVRTTTMRQTRGLGDFLSPDYVVLAELAMLGQFREVPDFLFSQRWHAAASRSPGTSNDQVVDWHRSQRYPFLEYWTVFAQHILGILHLQLSGWDKLRCVSVLPNWLWIWREPLSGELKGLLLKPFSDWPRRAILRIRRVVRQTIGRR
ncbi:MAG: hypothetical protein ACRD1T_19730, partial [Acidimicrobiia bacterium]